MMMAFDGTLSRLNVAFASMLRLPHLRIQHHLVIHSVLQRRIDWIRLVNSLAAVEICFRI